MPHCRICVSGYIRQRYAIWDKRHNKRVMFDLTKSESCQIIGDRFWLPLSNISNNGGLKNVLFSSGPSVDPGLSNWTGAPVLEAVLRSSPSAPRPSN